MKYLNNYSESKRISKVDSKIELITDIAYQLTDDGFKVDIYKGGVATSYSLPHYSSITNRESLNSRIIFIEITYNYYHQYIKVNNLPPDPTITENNFKNYVDEFVKDLNAYNLKVLSYASGPWYSLIKVDKYRHTTSELYIKESNFKNYKLDLIEVIPNKYVYHTSNPIFRDKISEEGLIPKYKSESWLSDTKIDGQVIFAVNSDNKKDWWNSTYDDDIYRIDTTNLKNKWYKDPNFNDGIYKSNYPAIITFDKIPVDSIQLIYKGSGESE